MYDPFPQCLPLNISLPVGSVSLTNAGDKRIPNCRRCEQAGSRCVYPTSRKRASLETKYESLRRQLVASNQADALGLFVVPDVARSRANNCEEDLLDHIDPNALQDALRRREKGNESTVPLNNAGQDVPSTPEQTHASTVSDISNLPAISQHASVSDSLHIDGQNSPQDHDWQDTIAFGPFSDNNGMFNFFDVTHMHGRLIFEPSV